MCSGGASRRRLVNWVDCEARSSQTVEHSELGEGLVAAADSAQGVEWRAASAIIEGVTASVLPGRGTDQRSAALPGPVGRPLRGPANGHRAGSTGADRRSPGPTRERRAARWPGSGPLFSGQRSTATIQLPPSRVPSSYMTVVAARGYIRSRRVIGRIGARYTTSLGADHDDD